MEASLETVRQYLAQKLGLGGKDEADTAKVKVKNKKVNMFHIERFNVLGAR